jgi:hypothetical protein
MNLLKNAKACCSEYIICLIQLRKYMNEILLDQIPTLSIMLRALE